ncbi:hypothetical protein ABMA28_008109 [Loxostege sticticalis]|uniref:MADF domain-containing protein n=1 Tax=Loxostege sticticalis TaxID=481309 RepID=A0ABD0SG13_LOXSC
MLVSISRSQQVKCACTISRKMSRWGDEKTLKFVILYRNNECLWNPRIPQYKNNVERNNAYEDLLTNMEDPSLTVKIIKTKIKNLRSAYHAVLKKVENSKRSSSGAATVYKASAAWFDEMNSFLGDTSEYREPIEVTRSTKQPNGSRRPRSRVSMLYGSPWTSRGPLTTLGGPNSLTDLLSPTAPETFMHSSPTTSATVVTLHYADSSATSWRGA